MSGLTKKVEKKLVVSKILTQVTALPTFDSLTSVLGSPASGLVRLVHRVTVYSPDSTPHTASVFGGTLIAPVLISISGALATNDQHDVGNIMVTSGQILGVEFTTAVATVPLSCVVEYEDIPSAGVGGGYQTVAVDTSTTLVAAPVSGVRLLYGGIVPSLSDPKVYGSVKLANYDASPYVVSLLIGGTLVREVTLPANGTEAVSLIGGGLETGQALTMTVDSVPTTPIAVWVAWRDLT